MFHKDEAHRVIAISLGKIASYRNQRGGSSLHKNVLVANVLQKVRTFVSEDQSLLSEQHSDEICSTKSSQLLALDVCSKMANDNQNDDVRPNEETEVLFSKSRHFGFNDVLIGCCETRDSVNGSDYSNIPVTDYGAECEVSSPSSQVSYTKLQNDGESSVRYDASNDRYTEMVPAARGVKRRQDMYEKDNVYPKRPKPDNEFPFFNDTSWRLQPATISDTDSESDGDCLDLDQDTSASSQDDTNMDTEQICSLVSVFKCSFHGLGLLDNSEVGVCEDEVTSTDYGYSSSHLFVQELTSTTSRVGKPNALRRGLSLPDLCAKQADLRCQPFQLTAPVLALTV